MVTLLNYVDKNDEALFARVKVCSLESRFVHKLPKHSLKSRFSALHSSMLEKTEEAVKRHDAEMNLFRSHEITFAILSSSLTHIHI
jgi:hypothetical protein